MKNIFKKFTFAAIFLGVFLFINSSLAATTCEQKYQGYGQCATDCSGLGSDYQKDAAAGLCTSGSCCYKTGGEAATTEDLLTNLKLQVPIFDVANVNNLPEYIGTLYRYLVIILVPLAIVMIIVGGVAWIAAAGDQGKITNAKKYITSAFAGLIIGLFSYVLLSLVGLNILNMPGIEIIERQEGGDLMIIDGVAYSQEAGNALLPPGRRGSADAYQRMACPTKANPTFQVYFTNYYTPAYGDKGFYTSFGCNVGMQCSCPTGSTGSKSCHAGSYSWAPCKDFPSSFVPGKDYCNHTASQKPPVKDYTIAGDIPRKGRSNACFKLGCKLSIEGKGNYEITDTGSTRKIIGLHMDYYSGIGTAGTPPAGVYQVTITNPDFCLH